MVDLFVLFVYTALLTPHRLNTVAVLYEELRIPDKVLLDERDL